MKFLDAQKAAAEGGENKMLPGSRTDQDGGKRWKSPTVPAAPMDPNDPLSLVSGLDRSKEKTKKQENKSHSVKKTADTLEPESVNTPAPAPDDAPPNPEG